MTGVAEAGGEVTRVGYAPITRVDAERREIELCATSEALDAHGTIFDYEASKEAFTRWAGNVREMHDRRAVGRRVMVRCDDAERKVFVRLRISRGAQDTWEKVLDGTLRGASIGASDVVWRRERRTVAGRPRSVNVAARYDLVELSLVDNPSNPDAVGVSVIRAAAPVVALLDPLPETGATWMEDRAEGTADEPESRPGHRAGAEPNGAQAPIPEAAWMAPSRESDATEEDPEERERETLHSAARTLLDGCGCPLCAVALAALEAPIDASATSAPDSASATRAEGAATLGGARVERMQVAALARAMVGSMAAGALRLDRLERSLRDELREVREKAAREKAVLDAASASAHVSALEALEARIAAIEAQPLPGGPAGRQTPLGLRTLARGPQDERDGMGDEMRALDVFATRRRNWRSPRS